MNLRHLRRAIELSRAMLPAGEGGSFGAVVECEGKVVGEAWNRVVATSDPTAHAEVVALERPCLKRSRRRDFPVGFPLLLVGQAA